MTSVFADTFYWVALINKSDSWHQCSELSDRQKGKILSELLLASIHLHSHCDENWQNLISDQLETLADD
ncbi:hypothetical protein PN471_18320 [Aphanizomenon sp. CS-733/32]|uniref:hypothetical protein n=1 Tax=Aphanizomenon sp. CS-733/32 TaxID=3021715 RepID=UPI00232DCC98|nr:hypothetical protein [Aphanizomenon sp. CS-733/32]MDB9310542.1 hypothetical protein [Aphanizomenon sp. CS-733/32]